MPQLFKCSQCGFILARSIGEKTGQRTKLKSRGINFNYSPMYVEDVVERYDGKCPSCGKKLRFNPENVEILLMKTCGLDHDFFMDDGEQ